MKERVSFQTISCLTFLPILKIEVICSAEIPLDFHRIAWRYTAEERASSSSSVCLTTLHQVEVSPYVHNSD
jgi:hypothetical protein